MRIRLEMGKIRDAADRLVKENKERTNLEYCGKFRSLWKGWCGASKVRIFGDDEEVFMCERCIERNLIRLNKEFASCGVGVA